MRYGVTFQFEAETREEAQERVKSFNGRATCVVELGPDTKWTDVCGIEESDEDD